MCNLRIADNYSMVLLLGTKEACIPIQLYKWNMCNLRIADNYSMVLLLGTKEASYYWA